MQMLAKMRLEKAVICNMKSKHVLIIVFVSVLFSCYRNERPVKEPKDELERLSRLFSLFDRESFSTNASDFIFSKAGRFQRSFIIVVKVRQDRRRLIFQEIEFDTHKNDNNDIHFKGSSFDLDDPAWSEILERSETICNEGTKNDNYGDGLDSNSYIISREGNICGYNFGKTEEEEQYEKFSKFILALVDNLGDMKKMK